MGHIFSGTYLDCGTVNGYNNSLKKVLIWKFVLLAQAMSV
jgi:hypothetical protein